MATATIPPTTEGYFQELILQRRAERVEYLKKKKTSLNQNLKRIAEMKSKNGIHPLTLFPKEIWMEIMDKINPKDRWNMYQIHPTFSNLLESTKIRDVLFPLVLSVMMNQLRNDQNYGLDYNSDDIIKSDLVPFIKLREVCKSLRNAIDHWFEVEHVRMIQNHHSMDPEENAFDFRNSEDRERLTNITFEMCPKEESAAASKARLHGLIENFRFEEADNDDDDDDDDDDEDNIKIHGSDKRFFLRSVQVVISAQHFDWSPNFDFDPDQVMEDGLNAWDMLTQLAYKQTYAKFVSNIVTLLQSVGNQIWYFKLTVDPWDDFRPLLRFDIVAHYIMLQTCCQLMPNLKRLEISFYIREDRVIQVLPRERIVFPQNVLAKHPFPKLNKLEKVYFEQGSVFNSTLSLYNAVLKSNPQIKILKFEGLSAAFEGISSEALKALKLESFMFGNDLNDTPPCTFDFTVWQNILEGVSWPLKELQFRVICAKSARQVFQFLEKFQALEHVGMRLEEMEVGSEVGFLALPNLTHFQIAFSTKIDYNCNAYADICQFFSLQFLLHLNKLRHLLWRNLKTNDDTEASCIQFEDKKLLRFMKNHECQDKMLNFRGGMRDLTYSNLWEAFPELEFVRAACGVTSRHLSTCGNADMRNEYHRFNRDIRKESIIEFSEELSSSEDESEGEDGDN